MFLNLSIFLLSFSTKNSLNIINSPKPNLVFFTGANSLMPSFIYSNFIYKLSENYKVTVINNLDKNENKVLTTLLNIYKQDKNFVALGHSSGATSLLNYCNKFDLNKYIFLDPVDNNKFLNNKELIFNNNDVLIINAEKSYKWKFNNFLPKIPFIPVGKLKNEFAKYNEITIKDAGHCDILDEPYNNFMNNNLFF